MEKSWLMIVVLGLRNVNIRKKIQIIIWLCYQIINWQKGADNDDGTSKNGKGDGVHRKTGK